MKLIEGYTIDIIAVLVVAVTMFGTVAGYDVPSEPMMFVLGYFFGTKAAIRVEGMRGD